VSADITFLAPAEGGRTQLPDIFVGAYRPHLVVEPGDGEYLGVQFISGPASYCGGVPARFTLELMYPQVDYSPLVAGAAFTVREGNKVVARGTVVRRHP
jgi:hypothetical protein